MFSKKRILVSVLIKVLIFSNLTYFLFLRFFFVGDQSAAVYLSWIFCVIIVIKNAASLIMKLKSVSEGEAATYFSTYIVLYCVLLIPSYYISQQFLYLTGIRIMYHFDPQHEILLNFGYYVSAFYGMVLGFFYKVYIHNKMKLSGWHVTKFEQLKEGEEPPEL